VDVTVSEIHRYPLRPEGFAEPLFLEARTKKEIAEHLAASGWLCRAAEAPRGEVLRRRCHLFRRQDGSVFVVRREGRGRSRCRARLGKRRVRRVLERWRKVREWWEPDGGADRLCFRVQLCGGAVLDLACERGEAGGRWLVAGVVD
jgi:hypothetical protein